MTRTRAPLAAASSVTLSVASSVTHTSVPSEETAFGELKPQPNVRIVARARMPGARNRLASPAAAGGTPGSLAEAARPVTGRAGAAEDLVGAAVAVAPGVARSTRPAAAVTATKARAAEDERPSVAMRVRPSGGRLANGIMTSPLRRLRAVVA